MSSTQFSPGFENIRKSQVIKIITKKKKERQQKDTTFIMITNPKGQPYKNI